MENQLLYRHVPLFELIPENSKFIVDIFCSTNENDKSRLNEELLKLSQTEKNYANLVKIYEQIRDYMLSKCTKGRCQKILDYIESSTLLNRAAPVKVLADYLIIGNPIGSGSYGEVVKAYHKLTGTPVAIKISKFNEGLVDFTKELGLWKLLNHPNIVRFYESFDHDKKKHIVMELAQYKDLATLLKDRENNKQNLGPDEIRHMLRQITLGLKYLHSLSIVHRDLKPENILVFIENGAVVLKLCDFSHMRQEEDIMTSLRGTPLYNAPEISIKKIYDSKAEIWSVGVMLYEMIFGRDKVFQLYKEVHVEKKFSPDNIPIVSEKEDLIYLLKDLLQPDPEYRIDWERYFDNPLFKNDSADNNSESILQIKSDFLSTDQKIDQILTKLKISTENLKLEEKLNMIETNLENLSKKNEDLQKELESLRTKNIPVTPTPESKETQEIIIQNSPTPNPFDNILKPISPTPSPNSSPQLSDVIHTEKDFQVGSVVKVIHKKLSNNTHIFMLSGEDKNYYVATQSLIKDFRKEYEAKCIFKARIASIKSEKAKAYNSYTLKEGTSYFVVQIEKLP